MLSRAKDGCVQKSVVRSSMILWQRMSVMRTFIIEWCLQYSIGSIRKSDRLGFTSLYHAKVPLGSDETTNSVQSEFSTLHLSHFWTSLEIF